MQNTISFTRLLFQKTDPLTTQTFSELLNERLVNAGKHFYTQTPEVLVKTPTNQVGSPLEVCKNFTNPFEQNNNEFEVTVLDDGEVV